MNLVSIYQNVSNSLTLLDNDTLLYLFFAFRDGSMARCLVYKELVLRGVYINGQN